MDRRSAALVALTAAHLAFPGTALACGVCVEDKMAAVYDHAVVTRALAQQHQVAFFHIDGRLLPGDATRRSLEALAGAAAGVDRNSARVSVESASLSVAFDPRQANVAVLQAALERKLAVKKTSLMLLQVIERPADFSPSVSSALRAAGK